MDFSLQKMFRLNWIFAVRLSSFRWEVGKSLLRLRSKNSQVHNSVVSLVSETGLHCCVLPQRYATMLSQVSNV